MKFNELLKVTNPATRINIFSVNGIYHNKTYRAGEMLDKENKWTITEMWAGSDNVGNMIIMQIEKGGK